MLRTAAQDSICRKARERMLPIPPESAPSAKAEQSSRQGPFSELDRELREPPRRCTTSPDIRGPPGPHTPTRCGPHSRGSSRTCPSTRPRGLSGATKPPRPRRASLFNPRTCFPASGCPRWPREQQHPQFPLAPPPEGSPSGSQHVLGSSRSHPQRRQLPSRSQQAPVLSGLQQACQGHRPPTSPPSTPGLASSSFVQARSPASAPHLLCEAPAAPGGRGPRIRTAPPGKQLIRTSVWCPRT